MCTTFNLTFIRSGLAEGTENAGVEGGQAEAQTNSLSKDFEHQLPDGSVIYTGLKNNGTIHGKRPQQRGNTTSTTVKPAVNQKNVLVFH